MNLNPKNWFEISKKRDEARKSLARATERPLTDERLQKKRINLEQENLEKAMTPLTEFEGTKTDLLREYRASGMEELHENFEYQKFRDKIKILEHDLDMIDRDSFEILRNGRGDGFTGGDERLLGSLNTEKIKTQKQLDELKASPETRTMYRMHQLQNYHEQLISDNFIETPSRTGYMEWVKDQMKNHRAILLEGSTGTGKTELLIHTAKKLGQTDPELLPGNPNVTKYDLLGTQGLDSNEHGTITTDKPGYLPRAMRDGKMFLWDEINTSETKVRFTLKPFYRYSGSRNTTASIDGISYPVNDGFMIAATANLKGDKHKDRFDLDGAEARVFAMKHIEYPPNHELYDMALATLQKNTGDYIITESSAKTTLKYFVDGAIDIQEAYEKSVRPEFDVGSGTKKTSIEKAVLDPGEFMTRMKSYTKSYAEGVTFEDYINRELGDFISKGAYPEKDRVLMYKILKSKGFLNDFDTRELQLTDQKLIDQLGSLPTVEILEPHHGIMNAKMAALLDPYELRKTEIESTAESFAKMAPEEVKTEKKERHKKAPKNMEALAKSFDVFWKDTYKGWDSNLDTSGMTFTPTPVSPSVHPYRTLATQPDDKTKFGQYFINPETQNLDFEKLIPFIPDLSAMNGKKLYEVFEHIATTYSNDYYIPGIEYQKWLFENPDKIPADLKDTSKYFYFPGSSFCLSNGDWSVPCGDVDGDAWDRHGSWMGSAWVSSSRVVLLPKLKK